MDTILLHTCCAPCSTSSVERLMKEYNVVSYFYNPNIHPEEEYRLRKNEMKKISDFFNIRTVIGDYDKEEWLSSVKGLEKEPEGGKRCEVCFRIRLEKVALFAKEEGISKFTTTLSVSPHKSFEKIKEIGKEIERKFDVKFIDVDLKKKDGFKRSTVLSNKLGLYRQNYCGCIFSM